MPKPKVFMTGMVPGGAIEMLQKETELEIWQENQVVPRNRLMEKIAGVDGLYCLLTDTVDADVLKTAPRLKVISTMAVGYNHIDIHECTKRKIPVGYTPGVLTETTADLAFALMMGAARRIGEAREYVRSGRWSGWSPTLLMGQDVYGATLGIIGFGRIGEAVSRRAKGFGMRVLVAESFKKDSEHKSKLKDVNRVALDTLLRESDFVSLHLPLTKETHRLIGKQELGLMKKTAVLVNTARGSIVDPQALGEALKRGDIAGAALDVTDPEPISPDDPLCSLSNCLIVPHIGSASVSTRSKMAIMAAENILAGLKGKIPPYCVNPEVVPLPQK